MSIAQLALQIIVFGLALWLGLYLIGRNPSDARLRYAGLGLLAYAVGLGFDALGIVAADQDGTISFARLARPFFFLPALFWLALLIRLIPADTTLRQRLQQHPRPLGIVAAATLFFGLGTGFMFFPLDWVPRFWLVMGIGCDLALLGLVIAVLDAFDEGEALRPHFFRSLYYSSFTSLLFGGQVALAMAFSEGITLPMLILLLTTITASILIQTFSSAFQAILERLAFANYPRARRIRAQLHAAAGAAERFDESLEVDALDPDEFARLTRRALGNMGNFPRLAASPLTGMRLVQQRLDLHGFASTLERANALKTLLSESIERLKPPNSDAFGTTDEWRYYNALYFPYVLGLKPYSRRQNYDELSEETRQALAWFRTEIPQRTLYNWQNAAAKLVAQDLRERSRAIQGKQ